MGRLRGREAFALLWGGCMLIMAGFLFFPHAAWQAEAEQVHAERAETERELIDVENFINAHGNMDEISRELARHQENSLKAMPEELEQGEFLDFLQRLAVRSDVSLIGVVPGERRQERDTVALPIQVSLKCGYFQLLDFLKGLQEGDRFLQVKNGRIHSDKQGLVCEIDLMIFAMKP